MKNTLIKAILSTTLFCNVQKKYLARENKHDFSLWRSKHSFNQYLCPLNLPQDILETRVNPKPIYEEPEEKKPSLWAQFAFEAKFHLPDDEHMKMYAKKWLDKNIYIRMFQWEGEPRIFEGYRKGTTRYAKKNACKIQDWIQTVSNIGYETFALTLTYDVKTYGENRMEAWKNYPRHVWKTLEPLRKHYGAQYCYVLESTKNGYPHVHILLAFPKGTNKGYERMQNNKDLYYGWLFRKIKKSAMSPVFCLRAVKGKNVKYYMTKYITKQNTEDVRKVCEQQGELSESERKCIYELCFTCATNTRTFNMTHLDKVIHKDSGGNVDNAPTKKDILESEEYLNTVIQYAVENRDFARLRAVLIKLCTNSPLSCGNHCKMAFQKEISSSQKPPEQYLKENGRQIGCAGCVFQKLVCFIRDNEQNEFAQCFKKFRLSENEDENFIKVIGFCVDALIRQNYKVPVHGEKYDDEEERLFQPVVKRKDKVPVKMPYYPEDRVAQIGFDVKIKGNWVKYKQKMRLAKQREIEWLAREVAYWTKERGFW